MCGHREAWAAETGCIPQALMDRPQRAVRGTGVAKRPAPSLSRALPPCSRSHHGSHLVPTSFTPCLPCKPRSHHALPTWRMEYQGPIELLTAWLCLMLAVALPPQQRESRLVPAVASRDCTMDKGVEQADLHRMEVGQADRDHVRGGWHGHRRSSPPRPVDTALPLLGVQVAELMIHLMRQYSTIIVLVVLGWLAQADSLAEAASFTEDDVQQPRGRRITTAESTNSPLRRKPCCLRPRAVGCDVEWVGWWWWLIGFLGRWQVIGTVWKVGKVHRASIGPYVVAFGAMRFRR